MYSTPFTPVGVYYQQTPLRFQGHLTARAFGEYKVRYVSLSKCYQVTILQERIASTPASAVAFRVPYARWNCPVTSDSAILCNWATANFACLLR
jgi:hypothetical protein